MNPENEKTKESSSGLSRAAKKRAKKKSKNNNSMEEQQQPEIVLKVSSKEPPKKKRALEVSCKSEKRSKLGAVVDNDDAEGDDEKGAAELNSIVLPEDIQELLKSDNVKLKDILLLKNKNSAKAKDKGDDDKEMEEDENPFEELTSKERARSALTFLLAPSGISVEEFYDKYWEKKALVIPAPKHRKRFQGFLSLKAIRQLTEKHTLHYGKDLNVTRYHTIGKVKRRANMDPPPYEDGKTGELKYVEADSSFVWEQYDEKKATVRLLCPHKQNDNIHALLSLMEMEWGCMVGANAYLTPSGGSQGFAPHYDDIEAFCLQLEGRKRWKVYAPAKEARLPRVSSEDFTEEQMQDKEAVLDVVLEPGDMLYMPRGWIHHGITLPPSQGNDHSLHLTMSAMQQWSWVDYLELIMPEALDAAAHSETSVSLRTGLPRGFVDYMGAMYDQREDSALPDRLKVGAKLEPKAGDKEVANDEAEDEAEEMAERHRIQQLQDNFRNEAKRRIMRVAKEAMDMVDAGCDQIGKRFLSDRLPPGLTPNELVCTSEGQKDGKIWPSTLVRLARPGIARLVLEDGKAVLYHCCDNSRVFHEVPLSPMEFEVDDAPALEQLVTTVEPNWIPVQELISESMEDKIAITQSLYDEGILAIINPDGDPA